jgi:type IV pilus assembly protein PilC
MSDFLILDEDNHIDIDKKIKEPEDMMVKINNFLYSFQKVQTKEKVIFYRLLSTMTNAGMALIKSIGVLEKQEKNPLFKKILIRFIEKLKE